MGISSICSNQKYIDQLNSWFGSEEAHNALNQGCTPVQSTENTVGVVCTPLKEIPADSCEAKVKHYAADLAKHIYKETGLPSIEQTAINFNYLESPILTRCRSLFMSSSEETAVQHKKWSDVHEQFRKFSQEGTYEKNKLAEITKTHPEAGDALSALYKEHKVNLFKNSLDKLHHDVKESGAEAKCSELQIAKNFATAKTVGVVLIAIAVIAIAAKVYCDKQKEKEKENQKAQVALKA